MSELHVVSGLVPDQGRAGAVRIEVDGEPYCKVARAVVDRLALVRGAVVDEALREELQRAADVEGALRTALRALSRRAFARTDLGRRLVRKGHPGPAVSAALDQATGLGVLDDASFARDFAEARAARGQGPARVRLDLRSRGVAEDLVHRALADAFPSEDEVDEMVARLAEKRAKQLAGLPGPTRRRRLLAYLARRGFGGSTVVAVVERLTKTDAA